MQSASEMVSELGLHVDDTDQLKSRLSNMLILVRGPLHEQKAVAGLSSDAATPPTAILHRAEHYARRYRENSEQILVMLNELHGLLNGDGPANAEVARSYPGSRG